MISLLELLFLSFLFFFYIVRPPTPPSPGPLIIKEVREPQAAPAPPLVIRTQAPREKTPPPIIIREAPPNMPQVDTNPRYLTRTVRQNESPYSSSSVLPQRQQHYQQHYQQQYHSFDSDRINYNQYYGIQNGNPYTNAVNPYGDQQQTEWITELVSSNGTTSAAPSRLLSKSFPFLLLKF